MTASTLTAADAAARDAIQRAEEAAAAAEAARRAAEQLRDGGRK